MRNRLRSDKEKKWIMTQEEAKDGWTIIKIFDTKTALSCWAGNTDNMVWLEMTYPKDIWRRKIDIDQAYIAVRRLSPPKIIVPITNYGR